MEDRENECRVCRGGGESSRPLYKPCLCNGSIGLVHQDCLEAWLSHSKKDTCELCSTTYQFVPKYAEDAPSLIPSKVLLISLVKLTFWNVIPYILRILCAVLLWIAVVPIGTTFSYCFSFNKSLVFYNNFSFEAIKLSIIYGLLLDAVIAISVLILMSFTDFLRFHWAPVGDPDGQNLNQDVPLNANPGGFQVRRDHGNHLREAPVEDRLNNPVHNDEEDDNGVEIRAAILELLGLEGPFINMFRNAAWLLVFCSLYIFVLGYIPFIVGKTFIYKLSKFEYIPWNLLNPFLVMVATETSHLESIPVSFLDPLFIGVGYFTIFISVFMLNWLFYLMKYISTHVHVVVNAVNQLTIIVKVGCLLLLRILVLPLFLGTTLLIFLSKTIIDYERDMWISFITRNALGAYALAWVCGITFMLSMTISVLQLREVLHPEILAKVIKPQEAHTELINSLMKENGLVHVRRILLSLCVYMLLLGALVYSPLRLYQVVSKYIFHQPSAINWKFCYILPELQVPLELVLSHISFLSILDKRKDVIGVLQHKWLVMISKSLGLLEFLIPLESSEKSGESYKEQNFATVGSPLPRPPAGWDARTTSNSTRWAWGSETPSTVEKNVAPRLIPNMWLIRLLLLILLSWLLLNISALAMFFIPLLIGRSFMCVLQIPSTYVHDPLCFFIGLLLFKNILELSFSDKFISHAWKIFVHPDYFVHGIMLVVLRIITHCVFGILAHLVMQHSWEFDESLVIFGLALWARGAILLELCCALLLSNKWGVRLVKSISNDVVLWFLDCKLAVSKLHNYILEDCAKERVEEQAYTAFLLIAEKPFQKVVVRFCWIIVFAQAFSGGFYVQFAVLLKKCIIGWISMVVFFWLWSPISSFCKSIYRKIFDENYLIGKQLMNLS